jgi:ethanolamine ammonia-lyase small subunit
MPSLRSYTNARVDLGRVGDSVPTAEVLKFRLAHARARDAVHLAMDSRSLVQEFAAAGWDSIVLISQARTREEYLLRPDLGRRLSEGSKKLLAGSGLQIPLLCCVADGLSAAAVHRHAAGLLNELKLVCQVAGPVLVIEQGRVAIGDEAGERVGAEICVLLIGERPGLSSPDSLGVYVTYGPRTGRSDAERNCVSNIHDQGLSYRLAAAKIAYLVNEARVRKLSGVELKERTGLLLPPGQDKVQL